MMSQSTNYEQNWCATTNQTTNAENLTNSIIKAEPQNEFESNNNTMLAAQRASIAGESNPTSPHSVGSDESIMNHQNMYYNDTINSLINGSNLHRPLGFNPLTPPDDPRQRNCPNWGNALSNVCLPRTIAEMNNGQEPTTPSRRFSKVESNFNTTAALTPSHTPPMDQTPPKSPKFRSDASEKDCTDLDNSSMSGDDAKSLYSDYNQEISMQKVNSHGKVKTHKCKHCDGVFVTKKDFWEHSREHIKPERQIQCAKCPFVTEYKHHYEYHLRNHEGSKPFKCPECNYTCVNKSMLNSHLKSHSDIYQYRCENCNYATKYVHSLKLHLRKYGHQPAVPLDLDGCPDPAPVIDVYGTRRGPKKRSTKSSATKRALKQQAKLQKEFGKPGQHSNPIPPQLAQPTTPKLPPQPVQSLQNPLASILNQPNHFLSSMLPFNMQMLYQQYFAAQLSPNQYRGNNRDAAENIDCDEDEEMHMVNGNGRLDGRSELDIPESPTSSVPNNVSFTNHHNKNIDDDSHLHQNTSNVEHSTPKAAEMENTSSTTAASPITKFDCKFCRISFEREVMHSIHMGYHGFKDVFTCNMCGEKCSDEVSFFLHITKNPH